MPFKAIYRRSPNRIYFATDFKDGEEVELFSYCDKPSACAIGNVFYINEYGHVNLVNIKDLEPI